MQRVKDMLGDLLMTVAIWCDSMAGKLYEKKAVDEALKELDRLVDEAQQARAKTLDEVMHGTAERRETHYPVGVIVGTRIANVWIPKGTTWTHGGVC